MAQLQGNTNFEIDLSGRTTGNPLAGRQDMAIALVGKSDTQVNLAARFGLGFVSIINLRIRKMVMLTPSAYGVYGYANNKAKKLMYIQ